MKAEPISVDKWINCKENFEFDIFAPKIKVVHVFQMLCPGCVYQGIPQTVELYQKFESEDVSVVGLHSVFENHHAMTPAALEVFVSEWRLPFPVGIDKKVANHWMPETMKNYQFQGTPSLLIVDHESEIQLHHFGHIRQEKLEEFLKQLIRKKQAA